MNGRPIRVEIGERLRAAREARGLSLRQAAARAGLAVSYLSDVERGTSLPSLTVLIRLVQALGTSVGQLLPRIGRQALAHGNIAELGPGWSPLSHEALHVSHRFLVLAPGQEEHSEIGPGFEVFAYVLAGRVRVEWETGVEELGPHDALNGARLRSVRWSGLGPDEARLLVSVGDRHDFARRV